METKDKISQDLKSAMLAKDEERLSAIRMIRAELLKAEKEKGQAVDETRVMAILQTMLKQRQDSIEQFEKAGREDLATKERAESEIIRAYLPTALSEDEIMTVIESVMGQLETPDPRQMGKIIGQVMGQLKATGKPFDGKLVNERVRARLGAA